MSQQPLMDCAICLETMEKKDFFPLKCCTVSLCKQCEPTVRQTHGAPLPGHPNHRFIRCPLCRQMEAIPFQLVSELILRNNVPRNIQEFYLDMAPNFQLTPEEQNQRNAREIHQVVEIQQRRQVLERENREQRIQQERLRLQREEEDRQYGANILTAMRFMDLRRFIRRRDQPPVQENIAQPDRVVQPLRVPNNPTLRVPQPQVPAPTARPHINLNARRQQRIVAPRDEPRRTRPCSNQNCYHRTVFRCQTHTTVACCRNCVCSQC